MRPLAVVVVREVGELSLKIACGPKGHVIEEFPSDGSDESFDEGVRQWNIWQGLDLLHLQDPETRPPTMEEEQRVVVGAQ